MLTSRRRSGANLGSNQNESSDGCTRKPLRSRYDAWSHPSFCGRPYYDSAYKERDGDWDSTSTSSHGSNSSASRQELHPNMKNCVYYA